jgi:hypothetical protein
MTHFEIWMLILVGFGAALYGYGHYILARERGRGKKTR